MTGAERRAISQAWLQVGEDALAAADALSRIGRSRSCVSRSYYAAYAFLAGALALYGGGDFREGREGPEHEGLSGRVAERLKGKIAGGVLFAVRRDIGTLYQARLIADYRPRGAVDPRLAVESMKSARTIAKAIRPLIEPP